MTLREIRSNCGNLQSQPLHASLLNSSGLFLDFSWITGKPEVISRRSDLHHYFRLADNTPRASYFASRNHVALKHNANQKRGDNQASLW